ncbi:hypothetical protein GCM10027297_38080 [Parahaliea aestuarii]
MLLGLALLGGCGREVDKSFCALHGSEHWQHREQQAQLLIDYAESGDMAVQLTLPGELAAVPLASPGDILALPEHCEAGALLRESEAGMQVFRFGARCGDVLPESLSVSLLGERLEVQEIEVSMSTPAVRKHFVVHRDCERAMFNIDGESDGE